MRASNAIMLLLLIATVGVAVQHVLHAPSVEVPETQHRRIPVFPLPTLSTVGSGSLFLAQAVKPYYYNGYCYSFFVDANVVYYKFSSDGNSWGDPVSVAPVDYGWAVMGIDNKVLLVRIYGNYHKARVGTIQDTHLITWGLDANLGVEEAVNRRTNCYVTKVDGVRKMFVLTTTAEATGVYFANDRVYVSDNDGEDWTDLGRCSSTAFGSFFYSDYLGIPFNDGNKLQEILCPVWCIYPMGGDTYEIGAMFRDGNTFANWTILDDFTNEYYLYDQASAVFDGTYVNLLYIDNSSNLLHKRVQPQAAWQTVGTVKTGISADAGVTVAYDPASGELHIIYYEDTAISRVIWDGAQYSAEEILLQGESDIKRLIAYPNPLNSLILLNWQDATPSVRFYTLPVY